MFFFGCLSDYLDFWVFRRFFCFFWYLGEFLHFAAPDLPISVCIVWISPSSCAMGCSYKEYCKDSLGVGGLLRKDSLYGLAII